MASSDADRVKSVNMTSIKNPMPERCGLAESRHSNDYNVQISLFFLNFSHLIIQCFLEQLTLRFLISVVEVIKWSRRNLNEGRF